MDFIQIIAIIAGSIFLLAVSLAVMGWLSDSALHYMPMSPVEEHEWLTKEMGLSDEEAEEIMDDSWRERL